MYSTDTDTMPCWESHTNSNAVHGLVVTPLSENRPDVYYFGIMGDDVNACKSACAAESNCMVGILSVNVINFFYQFEYIDVKYKRK